MEDIVTVAEADPRTCSLMTACPEGRQVPCVPPVTQIHRIPFTVSTTVSPARNVPVTGGPPAVAPTALEDATAPVRPVTTRSAEVTAPDATRVSVVGPVSTGVVSVLFVRVSVVAR